MDNKFICIKCERVFSKKHHLNDHLNKKKPCQPLPKNGQNCPNVGNNEGFFVKNPEILPKNGQNNEIFTKNTPKNNVLVFDDKTLNINNIIEINDENISINSNSTNNEELNCKYCDTSFNRKYHLNRHMEKCQFKEMYEKYQNLLKNKDEEINNLKSAHNEEINNLKSTHNEDIIKLSSQIVELNKQIVQIAKKPSKVVNNNYYFNLNVVPFGTEKEINIGYDKIKSIILNNTGALIYKQLLITTNFNDKLPEYRNIVGTDNVRELITYRCKNTQNETFQDISIKYKLCFDSILDNLHRILKGFYNNDNTKDLLLKHLSKSLKDEKLMKIAQTLIDRLIVIEHVYGDKIVYIKKPEIKKKRIKKHKDDSDDELLELHGRDSDESSDSDNESQYYDFESPKKPKDIRGILLKDLFIILYNKGYIPAL